MKRILQAVTELWPGQEYSLGQISKSPWPPGGQVFRGQMCHKPQKHIYTSWGSYMCNMRRIHQAVTELRAGHEFNLDPLGDKVMRSNESSPERHIRPPWGPTCAICKESFQRLQSYGPDKNINTLTPWGVTFFGVKCVTTHKRHIYTSWGSYTCNMKRILQAVTELWPGQEYLLGQISISPWPPGGQVFRVKCVTTHKRHIYTSWGSCMCNMTRILQAVTELQAGQEYHLYPMGVMGSNKSFPQKGTSRPPRGHTSSAWWNKALSLV